MEMKPPSRQNKTTASPSDSQLREGQKTTDLPLQRIACQGVMLMRGIKKAGSDRIMEKEKNLINDF